MKLLRFLAIAIIAIISTNASAQKAVDLGLSVLWCDCNVGANSPEDYGDYYTFNEASSAARSMGSGWRLPSKAQLEELNSKCTWTWTGSGFRVTGPNGNSIYLPAAGYRERASTKQVGKNGNYWSSTPDGHEGANRMLFGKVRHDILWAPRILGYSVRPVRAK